MLQRSAQVFIAVKLIGALYLIILGVQAIRHRKSLATAMSAAAGSSDGWRWFAGSPRRYELVGSAGGLAMIGVGVTIAVTGRKS